MEYVPAFPLSRKKPDWASWRRAVLDSAHCRSDRGGDAGPLGLCLSLAALCSAGESPRSLIPVPVAARSVVQGGLQATVLQPR